MNIHTISMRKFIFSLLTIIFIASMVGCKKDVSTNPNWYNFSSGTTKNLKDIIFTSPNNGYILADSGIILKTENSGSAWNVLPIQIPGEFSSFSFPSNSTGFVVGSQIILKTINGGINWSIAKSEINSMFNSSFFTSQDIGFVVGGKADSDNGCIFKTIDGGNTWIDLSNKISTNWLYSVYFVNTNIGYAVGDYGQVLKTINSGDTWSKVNSDSSLVFTSVYFIDSENGYVAGGTKAWEAGIILKTTDGGKTWTKIQTGTRHVNSLFFNSNSKGYAISCDANQDGIIINTIDGGLTWSVTNLNFINGMLSKIFFINENTGYVIGENGMIMKWR